MFRVLKREMNIPIFAIIIAKFISEDAALKITLPLVTILQGVSYFVARNLLTRMEKKEKESICDKTMCNVVVV